MEEQAQEFIAKALRSLQVQIDGLSSEIVQLKNKVSNFDSGWDSPVARIGKIEYVLRGVARELMYMLPVERGEEIIIKSAAGKILSVSQVTMEEEAEEINGATD